MASPERSSEKSEQVADQKELREEEIGAEEPPSSIDQRLVDTFGDTYNKGICRDKKLLATKPPASGIPSESTATLEEGTEEKARPGHGMANEKDKNARTRKRARTLHEKNEDDKLADLFSNLSMEGTANLEKGYKTSEETENKEKSPASADPHLADVIQQPRVRDTLVSNPVSSEVSSFIPPTVIGSIVVSGSNSAEVASNMATVDSRVVAESGRNTTFQNPDSNQSLNPATSDTMKVDWESSSDILGDIFKTLEDYKDLSRCRSVCRSWYKTIGQTNSLYYYPVLISWSLSKRSQLDLYSPVKSSVYSKHQTELSVGETWLAGPSTLGYMLVFKRTRRQRLYLYNLFKKDIKELPVIESLGRGSEPRLLHHASGHVVISSFHTVIPKSEHKAYRVLNIYTCSLGDSKWQSVTIEKLPCTGCAHAYYDGWYYVVESERGPTRVINANSGELLFRVAPPEQPSGKLFDVKESLVVSPKGLLHVCLGYNANKSFVVHVHCLGEKKGLVRWVHLEDIHNFSIFLEGIYEISTDRAEKLHNSIYFTEEWEVWRNLGSTVKLAKYNFKTGMKERAAPSQFSKYCTWVIPWERTVDAQPMEKAVL